MSAKIKIAAAAILVLILAGVAWFALDGRDDRPETTSPRAGDDRRGSGPGSTEDGSDRPAKAGPEVPPGTHSPILYVGAVAADAEHPQGGRDLLDFMVSPEGRAILERFGFEPPAR